MVSTLDDGSTKHEPNLEVIQSIETTLSVATGLDSAATLV